MHPILQLPSHLRELKFRIYPVFFDFYDSDRGKESLESLGKLIEQAAQAAPNAQITIKSTAREPLPLKCQIAADAVLERLRELKQQQKKLSLSPIRSRYSLEAEGLGEHDNPRIRFEQKAR